MTVTIFSSSKRPYFTGQLLKELQAGNTLLHFIQPNILHI